MEKTLENQKKILRSSIAVALVGNVQSAASLPWKPKAAALPLLPINWKAFPSTPRRNQLSLRLTRPPSFSEHFRWIYHFPFIFSFGFADELTESGSYRMAPEERFRIVRSVGEECIQEDELMNLLTKKSQPVCYDGFEPSGRMHIAQVLLFI